MKADMSEEEILLKKAKMGENDSVEKLLKKYDNILKSKSNYYFVSGLDKEDIYQEVLIAFLNAIKTYDKQKGSFKTFLNVCIKGHMTNKIKEADRQKRQALNNSTSLDAKIYMGNDSDISLMDYVTSGDLTPEEELIKKDFIENIYQGSLEKLSKYEKEVLKYWLKGVSYKEMAEIFNKDFKSIDNAVQRIKNKIKK